MYISPAQKEAILKAITPPCTYNELLNRLCVTQYWASKRQFDLSLRQMRQTGEVVAIRKGKAHCLVFYTPAAVSLPDPAEGYPSEVKKVPTPVPNECYPPDADVVEYPADYPQKESTARKLSPPTVEEAGFTPYQVRNDYPTVNPDPYEHERRLVLPVLPECGQEVADLLLIGIQILKPIAKYNRPMRECHKALKEWAATQQ